MDNGETLSTAESLPDREQAKFIVEELRWALEDLHSAMRNLASSSSMNMDDIRKHCPEEFRRAKLAVDQAQDMPISGGTRLNGYYVARPEVI